MVGSGLGQGIQHLPWSDIQSHTFKEVSVLKRDGRTINRLTQSPQTALSLKTQSGQVIHLAVEDVAALKNVSKELETAAL